MQETRATALISGSRRSPGGGHGNPLPHPFLLGESQTEEPGRVTNSQTWLKQLSMHTRTKHVPSILVYHIPVKMTKTLRISWQSFFEIPIFMNCLQLAYMYHGCCLTLPCLFLSQTVALLVYQSGSSSVNCEWWSTVDDLLQKCVKKSIKRKGWSLKF